ncbi:glycine/betaine ABC transporter [Anaerocolumna cellulosilytica]|uniref:Glycine/betaine ABC transporter n=1 Tax=Anaerocolumna cellulosilytica TaxID=433286 RepID=A0A6S6R8Q2_9FIRM|nr:glycine betaine ABC transporter substrate-binding protein [Anaerocolumna cellulosilytica]MBB5197135.1 glycine betaine/proline transport system substrate-binding protein [Anaerocolumna cellulosilytica]BCJ95348.1 glycine/betaine ABC transporter [Anaerocolumna cellulosilytica]
MKKILTLVLALVLTTGLITGCSTSGKTDEKKIKIGYVNWAEGIAMTNLAAAILEEKLGYEVEMVLADVAPVFTSLASGNTDVFLDTWLPVTHGEYLEKYGKDIVDLGISYENALIGLVVPSYVEADTIEELIEQKETFGGKIIGIDSGAGIMSATEKAIEAYGLDYELVNGSGPAMTAALKKAINNNEAIVVTGWTPHWMFSSWDLKVLKDSKGIYGEAENIHIYSRKGFEEDKTEAAKFFQKYTFTDEVLSDLMGAIEESGKDPLETAKEWMNNNESQVNSWLGK